MISHGALTGFPCCCISIGEMPGYQFYRTLWRPIAIASAARARGLHIHHLTAVFLRAVHGRRRAGQRRPVRLVHRAGRDSQDQARGHRDAGEPVVRLLLRDLSRHGRHPDEGRGADHVRPESRGWLRPALSRRLNPATDGRPDPRPDVREDEAILGNLDQDFDFNQTPRAPILLATNPPTDSPVIPAYFHRRSVRSNSFYVLIQDSSRYL